MSNKSAKFRAWQNPHAYLNYGGYSHFERVSAKHDSNPMTRQFAGKNSRFKSGRSSHVDDKVRLAREHATTRERYSDPKHHHARSVDPHKFVGPQWSTEFEKQDIQKFRIDAMRQSGSLSAGLQRVPSRHKRQPRPRSRQYDIRSPDGGGLERSSRATTASHTSMVYVDSKQMRNRPQTATSVMEGGGGYSMASGFGFDPSHRPRPSSMQRNRSAPSFFRGDSAMFPPLPRHPQTYGRQVNVLDRNVAHHLVLKEQKAKLAARQQAMLRNFQVTSSAPASPQGPQDSIWPDGLNVAESTFGPADGDDGDDGDGGAVAAPFPMSPMATSSSQGEFTPGASSPARNSKFQFSRPPVFQPATTSTMRVERVLEGRPASREPRGTSRYGDTAPANAPPPAVLDYSASIDNMRVVHAATSLGRSLRFGESTMDKVDVPQAHPSVMPGSAGGMAALSMSSVYSPDPSTWANFAAQPLRPHPAVVRFGPLKVGTTYAFPATVRNHGLVARRLRVAGTHILPESSPADINVRYSSVRLAPGMSATVDILLHAEQPGKIVAQVEMSSEDDFFVIPVTATFLSPDGFQAAMEKSHNPKRKANKSHQYLSSGPADEAIEKLLIPGATHKFVMVVVPPSSNNATAGAAPSSPGAGEGLSIVEQMEAKLRAAGYTPKPIRSDRRLRRHHRADSAGGAGTASGDASAGEDDGGYGDEDADDDAGQGSAGQGSSSSGGGKKVGVEAMIKAAKNNKKVKARLDAAAQHIERAARGHLGRNKVKRIQAKQSKSRLK